MVLYLAIVMLLFFIGLLGFMIKYILDSLRWHEYENAFIDAFGCLFIIIPIIITIAYIIPSVV